MSRRYRVPPPGKATYATIAGLTFAIPLGVVVALAFTREDPGMVALVGLVAILVSLAVSGFLMHSLKRREVAFDGRELVIGASMYTRRLTPVEIDLNAARIVDLRERTELKPMLKLNGYSLPGFHAGHYWTRKRQKAFAMVTSYERVLLLPERSGTLILLSLEHPDRLLADLRKGSE